MIPKISHYVLARPNEYGETWYFVDCGDYLPKHRLHLVTKTTQNLTEATRLSLRQSAALLHSIGNPPGWRIIPIHEQNPT